MQILFVKSDLCWPRSSGHDVHCYNMMRAMSEMGHEISLATLIAPQKEAIAGLDLHRLSLIETATKSNRKSRLNLSWSQERFRSYWGIDEGYIQFVGEEAKRCQADAVVVVGLEVLPYLANVESVRVWYAADEWVWHHLSLCRLNDTSSWQNLRAAAIKGLYEWSYAKLIDRIWVVSAADRRAMNLVARASAVDVVPNGVDTDYFRPQNSREDAYSCVFWGRLDFCPNVHALEWFCSNVWPLVRQETPEARFRIFGFNLTPRIDKLSELDGVSITPDLPDIRKAVGQNQIVVFPFQSGGGIKNKFLEAASMGKPIIGSRRACNGLRLPRDLPFLVAEDAAAWTRQLRDLWSNRSQRAAFGEAARKWVLSNHTWVESARIALSSLERSVDRFRAAVSDNVKHAHAHKSD